MDVDGAGHLSTETMVNVPSVSAVIRLPSRKVFTVRPAREADVPQVAQVIHDAFEVWKAQGLTLGPMLQTDEGTRGHLIGTFSLENGARRRMSDGSVEFAEGMETNAYASVDPSISLPSGRMLVFKKAAVKREQANSGLGGRLYALAEEAARENGCAGMILETVKEARWLYEWYVRLGFKMIASYRTPGRQVDTVVMIKPF